MPPTKAMVRARERTTYIERERERELVGACGDGVVGDGVGVVVVGVVVGA